MEPVNIGQIDQHLAILAEVYESENGIPMSKPELDWFRYQMEFSYWEDMAFCSGNSFVYVTHKEKYTLAAWHFDSDIVSDTTLFAQMMEKCHPCEYIPLGEYFAPLINYTYLPSLAKWRMQQSDTITMTKPEVTMLLDYLHG